MASSEEGKDAEYYQDVADEAQEYADKAQEEANIACDLYYEAKDDDSKIPDGKTLDDLKKDCFDKREMADTEQALADKKQALADKKQREEEQKKVEEAEEERDKEVHIAEGDGIDKEDWTELNPLDSDTANLSSWNWFEPYKSYKYKVFFVPTLLDWCGYGKNKNKEHKAGILGTLGNKALITEANLTLGFNKITGISNETPAYAYNEGGENRYGNTFPMHTGAGDVTFSHGATRASTMGFLRNMVAGSRGQYCSSQFSMLIFMYGKGIPQIWFLKDVWPIKIEIGGYSTDRDDKDNIIIESLTVSVERAELDAIRAMNMMPWR